MAKKAQKIKLDKAARQRILEQRKWERSLDGINYAMDGKITASDELQGHILRVLQKIPTKIREWVCNNCSFWGFEHNLYGMAVCNELPYFIRDKKLSLKEKVAFLEYFGPTFGRWLILLSEHIPKTRIDFTIAHEIAHARLNHTITPDPKFMGKQKEDAANALAEKWGFKRFIKVLKNLS